MKKIFLAFSTLILSMALFGCSLQNKETAQNPVEIDINNVARIYLSSIAGHKELTPEEVKSIVDIVNSAEKWEKYNGPTSKGGDSISVELKSTETIQLYVSEYGFIVKGSFGSYNAKQSDYILTVDKIYNRKEKELTEDEALVKAIEYHNALAEVKSDYDFSVTIKDGDTVTKEVKVGGPPPEATVNLEMTVEVRKEGGKYIIVLTEDYNVTISGTKAVSFWKYEVSNEGVKLLDKKEDGNLIKIIK